MVTSKKMQSETLWSSVMICVLQGSALGPFLFSIFINDKAGLSTPAMFASDTKLSGALDVPEGKDVSEKGLGLKLERTGKNPGAKIIVTF